MGLSAAGPTSPDDVSAAPMLPVSNVRPLTPSNIRGGHPHRIPRFGEGLRVRIALSLMQTIQTVCHTSTRINH